MQPNGHLTTRTPSPQVVPGCGAKPDPPMTHPLSERQQLQLVLRTTTPAPSTRTALNVPVSPSHYLTWTTARRRAWDKRHTAPNAYFLHYLHPIFEPRPLKWSLHDHRIFLAALKRAPPGEQWGLFSLLVPGRVGSDCRRYFHRIGRAGFITLDGSVRHHLVSRAKVPDGGNVSESRNALFLKRSLRKFVPRQLPQIDDTLYKSLENGGKDRKGKRLAKQAATRQRESDNRKPPSNTAQTNTVRAVPPKSVAPVKASVQANSGVPAKSSVPAKSNLPVKSAVPVKAAVPVKSKAVEKSVKVSPTQPPPPKVSVQDLLTYIPPKPSEYGANHHFRNNHSVATTADDVSQLVPCRLKIRSCGGKKSENIRARSTALKAYSGSLIDGDSNASSSPEQGVSKKAASVKGKIRIKAPPLRKDIVQRAIPNASGIKKRKQSSRTEKVTQVGSVTARNVTEEGKENESCAASDLAHRPKAIQVSLQMKGSMKPLQESNRRDMTCRAASSAAISVDGSKPIHEGNLPDEKVNSLKRKSSTPLRPILKSRNPAKKRRENSRSVHFSESFEENIKPGEPQAAVVGNKSGDALVSSTEGHPRVSQKSLDGNASSDHEVDPVKKSNAGKTHGAGKFEKQESSVLYNRVTSHGNTHDATPASCPVVSHDLDKRLAAKHARSKTIQTEGKPTPSLSSSDGADAQSCLSEIQEQMELRESSSTEEFDMDLSEEQQRAHTSAMERTTPHPLHVSSVPKKSVKGSFEEKSSNHVESMSLDYLSLETESQATGTDGELLDMEESTCTAVDNDIELSEQGAEMSGLSSEVRNRRRVSGPTRGDRTSISFLMNQEDSETQEEKHKLASSSHVVGGTVDCAGKAVSGVAQEVESLALKDCRESSCDARQIDLASKDPQTKVESEYHVMQKRVDQTRLLLRLFVDVVEPAGESLGHKRQRLKLMESFEEALRWLHFTEGFVAKKRPLKLPSFLRAAQIAAELDNPSVRRHSRVHVGGLTHYWGVLVDSYLSRLKDMENRQKMEVTSKLSMDSCF